MKKLSLAISLLYGTTMLHGCASTTTTSQKWKVEPFQQIQHATNRSDGYYRLGRYYQGQNRLESAIEAYQKALAIDPHFTDAHNGLGTVYASQGKYEQALAEFNAVIATAPGAAHIYNNLGYLNFLQGNYAEAVTAFTQATKLDPSNQKAWNNLGMALARNGELTKSNLAFTNAIESNHAVQPTVANEPNHADQTAVMLTVPKNRGGIAYTNESKPDSHVAVPPDAVSTSENEMRAPTKLAQPTPQPPFAVLAKPNPDAMPVVVINNNATPRIDKVSIAIAESKIMVKEPATASKDRMLPSKAAEVMPATLTAINTHPEAPLPKVIALNSTDKVTKAEPKVWVKEPSAISKDRGLPSQSAEVTPVKQAAAHTHPEASPAKAIALKTVFVKAAPNRVMSSASIPGIRKYELEVANGNGIKHFAAKFGAMLSAKGLPQASLTNLKPYNQARTVIQYRKGYLFEAARLSRHLRSIQHLAFVVESKDLSPNTDVKLVLGKDLSGKLQQISNFKPITLASR